MEANIRLQDCYMAVSKDQFESAPKGSLDGLCAREKNEVKNILDTNELNMTQMVKDRMAVLHAIEKKSQKARRAME